jgi:TPR repeat protein
MPLPALLAVLLGGANLAGSATAPSQGAADEVLAACNQGEARACYFLARLYQEGEGITRDKARAAVLFTKACDAGVAISCFRLAAALDAGDGVPKDRTKACSLWEMACSGGMVAGCHNAGVSYMTGDGVAMDTARALGFFEKACAWRFDDAPKYLESCLNLGNLYRTGGAGVPKDPAKALEFFNRGCREDRVACWMAVGKMQQEACHKQKNAWSCYSLEKRTSPMLVHPDEPIPLLAKACTGGDAEACFVVGEALAPWRGDFRPAPKDVGNLERTECYQKACDAGLALGCSRLGEVNFSASPAKAATFYETACSRGEPGACRVLGEHYSTLGPAATRDAAKAAAFYAKGCDMRDKLSCWRLGELFLEGSSELPRDAGKAAMFYWMACDLGDKTACKRALKLVK